MLYRPMHFCSAIEQTIVMSICLSVCLSASKSQETYIQTSPNFLCMFSAAVTWSSSDGVAICNTLVFVDDVTFSHNGPLSQAAKVECKLKVAQHRTASDRVQSLISVLFDF